MAHELGRFEAARGRLEAALDAGRRVPVDAPPAGPAAPDFAQVAARLGRLAEAERVLRSAFTGPAPTSSGTGHLRKGHGVSCGDWDRDGDVDLFIEMGGAIPGDRYHNILFGNPGQKNHWLTVKLMGRKTNRAAIGARIMAVTAGDRPLTVHRHVSSGSRWGANPIEQHIGLGQARRVALLEVHWPTGRTTQVLRDLAADQAIEVTQGAEGYRKLDWKPIKPPK